MPAESQTTSTTTPRSQPGMSFLGLDFETSARYANMLVIALAALGTLVGAFAYRWSNEAQAIKDAALETFQTNSREAVANLELESNKQRERAAKAEELASKASTIASEANTRTFEQQERAAKAEARVLELEQKNEPRRIPSEQFDRLVAALGASPVKGPVTLAWVIGSPEAVAYGNRFKQALEAAGWTVPGTTIMADVTGVGMAIVVRSVATAPPHATTLQQVLKSVGLVVDGVEREWVAEGTVQLLILTKP